jgi:hypothetical protein
MNIDKLQARKAELDAQIETEKAQTGTVSKATALMWWDVATTIRDIREAHRVSVVDNDPPEKPDKGEKGGSCNRRVCQAPGAMWFNHYTNKYYCTECARLINRANPEGWPIGSRKPAVVLHT